MMIILLFFCLVLAEIFHYLEICRLIVFLEGNKPQKGSMPPPKARGSFVVKRMEEKLKEAMYPET